MELNLAQLITIVLGAVVLASTDPAALSRLGMAWLSKKLGVKPRDITKVDNATDGDDSEN